MTTVAAVLEALGGTWWVLRNRRVVPLRVEQGLVPLERDQKHSAARRYVD